MRIEHRLLSGVPLRKPLPLRIKLSVYKLLLDRLKTVGKLLPIKKRLSIRKRFGRKYRRYLLLRRVKKTFILSLKFKKRLYSKQSMKVLSHFKRHLRLLNFLYKKNWLPGLSKFILFQKFTGFSSIKSLNNLSAYLNINKGMRSLKNSLKKQCFLSNSSTALRFIYFKKKVYGINSFLSRSNSTEESTRLYLYLRSLHISERLGINNFITNSLQKINMLVLEHYNPTSFKPEIYNEIPYKPLGSSCTVSKANNFYFKSYFFKLKPFKKCTDVYNFHNYPNILNSKVVTLFRSFHSFSNKLSINGLTFLNSGFLSFSQSPLNFYLINDLNFSRHKDFQIKSLLNIFTQPTDMHKQYSFITYFLHNLKLKRRSGVKVEKTTDNIRNLGSQTNLFLNKTYRLFSNLFSNLYSTKELCMSEEDPNLNKTYLRKKQISRISKIIRRHIFLYKSNFYKKTKNIFFNVASLIFYKNPVNLNSSETSLNLSRKLLLWSKKPLHFRNTLIRNWFNVLNIFSLLKGPLPGPAVFSKFKFLYKSDISKKLKDTRRLVSKYRKLNLNSRRKLLRRFYSNKYYRIYLLKKNKLKSLSILKKKLIIDTTSHIKHLKRHKLGLTLFFNQKQISLFTKNKANTLYRTIDPVFARELALFFSTSYVTTQDGIYFNSTSYKKSFFKNSSDIFFHFLHKLQFSYGSRWYRGKNRFFRNRFSISLLTGILSKSFTPLKKVISSFLY